MKIMFDNDGDNSDVDQIQSVKDILRVSFPINPLNTAQRLPVKGDISKLIMNSPAACVRGAL